MTSNLRYRRRFCSTVAVIVLLAVTLYGGLSVAAQSAEKELKFPKRKWAIGQLFGLRSYTSLGERFWKPTSLIAPADGTIRVQADYPLMLVISTEGSENLGELRALKQNDLKVLRLSNLPVTTKHLDGILHLHGLEDFICHSTDLNSSALPIISINFPELRSLTMSATDISDAHLDELVKLKKLRKLDIAQNEVTDAGIKALSKSSSITHLGLRQTKITPECIDDLLKMKQLKYLDIARDGMDDRSLRKLAALKNIKTIKIGSDKVTKDGILQFKKLRPDCKVSVFKFASLD